MADPKDPPKSGFFRKVVRFALNPTTDWADLNATGGDTREDDYAKSELKAMIERKRRNDFVRKREFDTLRKIRREGLTGEGLAGLDGLSHLDDSEVRSQDSYATRPDSDDVKDKIDAIERQMVGESAGNAPRRNAATVGRQAPVARTESFFGATTAPQVMATHPQLSDAFKPTTPMQMESELIGHLPPIRGTATRHGGDALSSRPPLGRISSVNGLIEESAPNSVEVTELAHDPDLDEAVIAFANADFELCERSLHSLISPSGLRAQHAETWYALFDLYRAIGQQTKFESLALDYTQCFGWSPPQWYSLPRLVADAVASERARPTQRGGNSQFDGTVGWVAPDFIDAEAVSQLRSQLLQMPLPWVLDWRHTRHIDAQAASALYRLLRDWADEPIEMCWLGGDTLFGLLADLSPTSVRDADPAYWMLRMEALRLTHRTLDFDQVAIDYCVTYEVSPPSWMPARCILRLSDETGRTVAPVSSIAEVVTGFMESQTPDEGLLEVATVELNGQLIGDIGNLLKGMDQQIGKSTLIQVSCTRLIRVDFIAAGDLLNWVLARHAEGRNVSFVDAHRLVALFCGAMGISEHARVTVRNF
jgi:prepilin-type processing-associated H-X9-DG protein